MRIAACNLKMNLLPNEIPHYIEGMKEISNDVIILPPAIYIDTFVKNGFNTGSQDISFAEMGAYTGDISILQLKELGIKYSIIGHSERRNYYLDDRFINKKIKLCLENDIMPILCVGETQEENNRNETLKVCKKELDSALLENDVKKIIIAYEPIWSIGTGVIPTNSDINETISYIKGYVEKAYDSHNKVLYGGSVSNKNIDELETVSVIDGYLVGGCSIKKDDFNTLINKVK
jgi:triosephosphate isomerase